ncbi:MAG TPA: DNA translocase FtsK [Verrucomicrobiae bacterium]|nr:DNA translocase FtsK [Verrucomicrobiae bacterium]
MKLLSPTQHRRLNEAVGFLLLFFGLVLLLSLVSYHVQDPSLNTASDARPLNLIGYPGSYLADVFLQAFGAASALFPLLIFLLAWKWIRSEAIQAGVAKIIGSVLLTFSVCAGLSFAPVRIMGELRIGGAVGHELASWLVDSLNIAGALLATLTAMIVSVYLVSSFTLERLSAWMAIPAAWIAKRREDWRGWRQQMRLKAIENASRRTKRREELSETKRLKEEQKRAKKEARSRTQDAKSKSMLDGPAAGEAEDQPAEPSAVDPFAETPPWETQPEAAAASEAQAEPTTPEVEEPQAIPICPVDELPPVPPPMPPPAWTASAEDDARRPAFFELPSTDLLNEVPARSAYDEQELKETAGRIKSKFEEFNVFGNVVQINPGPVVTTFEFKPEAGIKYSRITNLTEDLCLGLQAESILIERIPGKPTVGIEVPNTRRELIGLRQMLESEEFAQSHSHLTIPLGKDINGRIRVAALEAMPHLLIAGSTGSGKSVMINSMIMSILYKATPDEVRLIMVDPKRVELGMYENIPHLLTPVITDPKKATNALRNAVLEMERRLRLLAEKGCRNIDQFNKKVRKMQEEPRDLFDDQEATAEDWKPLPYILILIDELADLMMIEGRNVEESVTRLAQMARAVGMHLVLATQRPSVDVITGLIKANFPARLSFRVATRVDSRTILDVMGAEHLLGKGDMLFLPPGSSRLTRLHGAFVTETEINRVTDFWKAQAKPEYDQSFLIAPPNEETDAEEEPADEEQDPMYEEAVRLVLQMGKASTSTLQRHLRLGYGRAARILDMMQRDGIIGPPDGSKPREVLKRPDWLHEVESRHSATG